MAELDDDLELLRPEPPDLKAIWAGKDGVGNLLVHAFGSSLAAEDVMGPLKASATGMQDDLESALAWAPERVTHDSMRQLIDLEKLPFRRLKQETIHGSVAIQFMPRDNVLRQCYQVIFLVLLRRYIPVKCSFHLFLCYSQLFIDPTSLPFAYPLTDATNEVFLEAYPEFVDRPPQEQEYLRQTAEWMYVCFFTLRPFNNKGFLISLIPRLVEGPGCRYVTGSGETLQTSDRVKVFCTEGNFQKIKRGAGGPRKRGRLPNASANPVETARFRVGIEGGEDMAAAVLSALGGGPPRSPPRPPSLHDSHSSQDGDQEQSQGEEQAEEGGQDQSGLDDDDDATIETNLLQPRYRESKSSRAYAFPSDQGPPRATRVVRSVYSSEGTVSSSLGSFTSVEDFSSLTSSGERDNNSKFLVLHGGRIGARGRGRGGGRGRSASNASTSSTVSDHSSSIIMDHSSSSSIISALGAASFGEEEGGEKRDEAAGGADVDVAEQLVRLHRVNLHGNAARPDASSMSLDSSEAKGLN